MTPKQKLTLEKLGIDTTDLALSSSEAYKLIGEVYQEKKELSRNIADEARQESLYDVVNRECEGGWKRDTTSYAVRPCPIETCTSDDDAFFVMSSGLGGCRVCEWEKKGNGAGSIGFIMAYKDLSWHEAARHIVGNRSDDAERVVTSHVKNSKKKRGDDYAKFKQFWPKWLAYGQGTLYHSGAMAYLKGRGIAYQTARAFGVGANNYGYGPYRNEQCCLFPYYTADGELCAVNRRVARKVTSDKCWFAGGSQKRGFFGVNGWSGFTWVVEGEINAMSVYQALLGMGRSDTVVSLSSEKDLVGRADEIRRMFDHVVVWCDEIAVQDAIRELGVMAWATKDDANDLLLNGKLTACIEWMLARYQPQPKGALNYAHA